LLNASYAEQRSQRPEIPVHITKIAFHVSGENHIAFPKSEVTVATRHERKIPKGVVQE